MTIGIAVFDGAEELDFVGPWEVLRMWELSFGGPHVHLVAPTLGPFTCAKGMRVLADHSWATAPPLSVLVYAGGRGTRPQLDDLVVQGWLTDLAAAGALMTSVCTGSLVFAAAGLLAGRPATTHWASLAELALLDETIDIRPEDRFVDDGNIVTAAGVSAGIDMALHLVRRLSDDDTASQVRRAIQYDPEPPV
ncbi:DJ-1/PfpI family protein [soil metagenome]